jgi:GntR family transcriptional repressor for pyruvate dehydrogenase complex
MTLADETLQGKTVDRLVANIGSRGIRPGELLPTEAALVDELDVSRPTLREAVGVLKGMGLVESRQGRGMVLQEGDPVTLFAESLRVQGELGLIDMPELLTLRRTLELGSIDMAVRLATDDERQAVMTAAEAYAEAASREPLAEGVLDAFDRDFHSALSGPAKCRLLEVLSGVIDTYFATIRSARPADFHAYERSIVDKTVRDHFTIAHAYLNNQPLVALHCLRDHLDVIYANLHWKGGSDA